MPDIEFYRGGSSLAARPDDVEFDEAGLVAPAHGISVSTLPNKLSRFGRAYRLKSVPPELRVVQVGRNRHHYEVVPRQAMTFDDYQRYLDQIALEPVP